MIHTKRKKKILKKPGYSAICQLYTNKTGIKKYINKKIKCEMKRSDLLVFRQQLPSVKGSTALGNMRIPRCQASPLWIFGRLVSSLKYYQTRGLNPRADDYVHNILYPGLLVKLFLLTNPQSPSPDLPSKLISFMKQRMNPLKATPSRKFLKSQP